MIEKDYDIYFDYNTNTGYYLFLRLTKVTPCNHETDLAVFLC